MLSHESLEENGSRLTNCGRDLEKRSIEIFKRGTIVAKKPMKGSKKVWEDFIQWLRAKCIKKEKYFKNYCEWKWFVNMNSE